MVTWGFRRGTGGLGVKRGGPGFPAAKSGGGSRVGDPQNSVGAADTDKKELPLSRQFLYYFVLFLAYKLVVFASRGVVRMEQLVCFMSARFADELLIHFHKRVVLVRLTQLLALVY